MTANELIKNMLLDHPSLFESRLQVIDFLLLTIGTGYKWKDGAIVYIDNPERDEVVTIESSIHRLLTDDNQYDIMASFNSHIFYEFLDEVYGNDKSVRELSQEYSKEFVSRFQKHNEKLYRDIKRILNANNVMTEKLYLPEKSLLYPVCGYSPIMNIPDDIRDDWRVVVKELIEYLFTSDDDRIIKYMEEHGKELEIVKNKINNA